MPITVIPATDYSGEQQGWQIFANALLQKSRQKFLDAQVQNNKFEELTKYLADPNRTEAEQQAILSMEPKTFKQLYGQDISTVGKLVSQMVEPAVDPTANPTGENAGGQGPQAPGKVVEKRLMVPHPGGTPQEQQAAASLEQTTTVTKGLKQSQLQEGAKFNQAQVDYGRDLQKNYAREDGKVFSFNDAQLEAQNPGSIPLVPKTAAQKLVEEAAGYLGLDRKDPAQAAVFHQYSNSLKNSDLGVEKSVAELRNMKLLGDLYEKKLANLAKGLDEEGRPLKNPNMLDPKDVSLVADRVAQGMTNAIGGLSLVEATGTTPSSGVLQGLLYSVFNYDTKKAINNGILFGNPDPVAVRNELAAAVGTDPTKLKTVSMYLPDPKTGVPTLQPLKVNDAIDRIVFARNKTATEVAPQVAALLQIDPATVAQISQISPAVDAAIKYTNPQFYNTVLVPAREQLKAAATQATQQTAVAETAKVDPVVAGIQAAADKRQKEIDDLRAIGKQLLSNRPQ